MLSVGQGKKSVNIDDPAEPVKKTTSTKDVQGRGYKFTGSNLNTKKNEIPGDIALFEASREGHELAVLSSLKRGADVNGRLGDVTPLFLASNAGHRSIRSDDGWDATTSLHEASRAGHFGMIRLLLEDGADVNASGKYCGTPLQQASCAGHLEIVRLLLDRGADVNASRECHTALQLASEYGHLEIVRLLLEHGADVNVSGEYGTALQLASRVDHLEIIRILLDHGADVNASGKYYTSLQISSEAGYGEIVRLLLNHGAEVNASERYFGTSLQLASRAGHLEIVQLLLEHGADVNATGESSDTSLQEASEAGHTGIVRVLLEHGADVNATGESSDTSLQEASEAGHTETIRVLLEHGADVNVSKSDRDTSLQRASRAGHLEIVELLLDHGAEVDASGRSWRNSLQTALRAGHHDVVRILLRNEAVINACTEDGYTLQAASSAGHYEVVQILLEHGADVNTYGPDGSALQMASSAGHHETVKILLEHGADVEACGLDGDALQVASAAGHHDTVQILLKHGADVNVHGPRNALRAALSAGYVDVARLLLKNGADYRLISHDELEDLLIRNWIPDYWKRRYTKSVEPVAFLLLQDRLFRSLLAQAVQAGNKIEPFTRHLVQYLGRYDEELCSSMSDERARGAAEQIFSCPWHIVGMILLRCISRYWTDVSEARVEAHFHDLVSSVDWWDQQLFLRDMLHEEENRNRDRYAFVVPDPDEVNSLIISERAALDSFLNSLYRSLCQYVYANPLETVKAVVFQGIQNHPDFSSVEFNLPWKLDEYLAKEIIRGEVGEIDRSVIGSLLTLSGKSDQCYANSCKMYMKWKWPDTYQVLLGAMTWSEDEDDGSSGKIAEQSAMAGSVIFLCGSPDSRGDKVTARGTTHFLIEIGQQLAWLTASLRVPSYGQLSYSDSVLMEPRHSEASSKIDDVRFEIFSMALDPISPAETEDACWLSLFLGTVIARNYPIPERQGEKGVELPFDLMATAAGIMLPQCYDGGIYLKGHSRLLYPVCGSVSSSVQWHLVTSSSRRVSLPDDCISKLKDWLRVLDHRLLSNFPRTFLGYCRQVIVDLGTHKATDYHQGIRCSNAEDAGNGARLQAPTSLTWGTSGMGIFGATVTHSIVYGNALAQTVTGGNDDYLDVLIMAAKTPVILYDDNEESRRGWMVPLLRVILHMIHTWAVHQNCTSCDLPSAVAMSPAADNTRFVLEDRWNSPVRSSPNEEMSKTMTIKDVVMRLWDGIQKRVNAEFLARCQIEPGVELPTSKLYGWEYLDIVTGVPSRRKQLNFDGNWMDFAEDVMVLFGGNFGEVIKPAPDISICAAWNPIPPNQKYLTATVDCLQKLSYKRGGRPGCLTSSRLTNKCYWNCRSNALFQDCENCCSSASTQPGRCSKEPQTLDSCIHKSNLNVIAPSGGAIVFGSQLQPKRRLSLKEVKAKLTNKAREHIHQVQVLEPRSLLSNHGHENGILEYEEITENAAGTRIIAPICSELA